MLQVFMMAAGYLGFVFLAFMAVTAPSTSEFVILLASLAFPLLIALAFEEYVKRRL